MKRTGYRFEIVAKTDEEVRIVRAAILDIEALRRREAAAKGTNANGFRKRGAPSQGALRRTPAEVRLDDEAAGLCANIGVDASEFDSALAHNGGDFEKTLVEFRVLQDQAARPPQQEALEIPDEDLRRLIVQLTAKFGKARVDRAARTLLEGANSVSETARDPVIRGRIRGNILHALENGV